MQTDSPRPTILGVTDLAETLPYPGGPAPYGRACAAAPWPPAPAVPGSAARSPAAPGQCRRVSAPNGHAALALGTVRWRPTSPCRAEGSVLPAAARRRFKSQPLPGRGRGEERASWRREAARRTEHARRPAAPHRVSAVMALPYRQGGAAGARSPLRQRRVGQVGGPPLEWR